MTQQLTSERFAAFADRISPARAEALLAALAHDPGSIDVSRLTPDERDLIASAQVELEAGATFLAHVKSECTHTVTFFGSARNTMDASVYKSAETLGGKFARKGYGVITGGGPGIMEAANKGAYKAGGRSVGLSVDIQGEPQSEFLTDSMTFDHLFVRRNLLAHSGDAYIFYPGGYGTLDELFEVLALVQIGRLPRVPIVLVGKSFWSPLKDWIKKQLAEKTGNVDEDAHDLFTIVNSANQAFRIVNASLS